MLAEDITDWCGSLWHGRRLACTVGALAVAGFLGIRWAAQLSARGAGVEPAPTSGPSRGLTSRE